jgi:anti-sigma regulatory factor (Ser/Thr protein kinase)
VSEAPRLRHRALVHADRDEFVEGVVGWLVDGLDAGEAAMLVAAAPKLAWVREGLGGRAGDVEHVDAGEAPVRPGPAYRRLERLLAERAVPGGPGVRLATDRDLGRATRASAGALLRWEAATNVLYEAYAAALLCAYDATLLSGDLIAEARSTHPDLWEGGKAGPSATFVDPAAFLARPARPAPDACGDRWPIGGTADLAGMRRRLRGWAADAGLGEEEIADLALAADEIAVNALVHGRPPWSYALCLDDGDAVCTILDGGPGPADPLLGFRTPDRLGRSGRGLWLANQLCDAVEIRAETGGTEVALRIALPGEA